MSISIHPFLPDDFHRLQKLLSLRQSNLINHTTMENLPKTGFIAMQSGEPVAAGFLRLVEGGYGQLDTFVTNPEFSPRARHEALDGIVGKLIICAEEQKLEGLIAVTKDDGVMSRSMKWGFSAVVDSVVIVKNLR